VQGLSTIAPNIQTAAFLWSVQSEGCDHRVPPNRKSPLQECDVSRTICRIREKVKYRPVMPNVECAEVGERGYIGRYPLDRFCFESQFFPSARYRRF